MKAYLLGGNPVSIESDRAAIALGHSERHEVGLLLAKDLESRGYSDVEIFTTNDLDSKRKRSLAENYFADADAYAHSRGAKDMPNAVQAILFNPMEPNTMLESLIRASMVGSDPVEKEPGAHKTGLGDLALAGVELLRRPQTSIATLLSAPRYSTTEEYVSRQDTHDFPAGITIVHSMNDAFGFPCWDNMIRLVHEGMTSIILDGDKSFHNSILFAPAATMDAVMNPQLVN